MSPPANCATFVDPAPKHRDCVGTRLLFSSTSLGIGAHAECFDQSLGLVVHAGNHRRHAPQSPQHVRPHSTFSRPAPEVENMLIWLLMKISAKIVARAMGDSTWSDCRRQREITCLLRALRLLRRQDSPRRRFAAALPEASARRVVSSVTALRDKNSLTKVKAEPKRLPIDPKSKSTAI